MAEIGGASPDPAGAPEPARPATAPQTGSDLPARVASALVMAAVVLAATWVGGWPFRVLWAVVAGLVAYEWLRIIERDKRFARMGAVGVAALGIVAGIAPDLAILAIAALLIVAARVIGGRSKRTMLGLVYATVLALAPAAMRDVPGFGFWLIIWSFAVVWFSDIVAYFVGRALGGPKLMPSVSPKKTWSGAIGGFVAGVAGGMVIWWLAERAAGPLPFGFLAAFIVSAVATILGQMGDLAESAFKRHHGVKDSSHIIPGHGGFMDRLDAYWAVVALAGVVMLIARLT